MNKTPVTWSAQATTYLPPTHGILQRKCACGNHTAGGGQCAECAKNKSGLQRKLSIGASNDPLEQEADRIADEVMAAPANPSVNGALPYIQRHTGQVAGKADSVPASVDHVLASSGRPFEPSLRQDMEQRFGYDFSHVRVHTGAAEEQSAREVNAHAYTVWDHIVFGSQQYQPGSSAGNQLLAHELAHTIQQGAVHPVDGGALHIGAPNNKTEHTRDRLADRVASGGSFMELALSGSVPMLQRAGGSAEIGSVGGCVARGGDITDFGESSDSIYLFNKDFDVFAPGEQTRLEVYASTIPSDARVDIDGFASEEGEPTFNENLSCARAQRAQEIISAITGAHTTAYKHGATPGDRQTHRSAIITVRTSESEPEPGGGEAPLPTEPVTPAAPALPVPPEDCPAAARETALDCTPNPQGGHLPPMGRTHDEAHPLQPCLLTEAQVAASPDWCFDSQQGHGGEVCYRQIPGTEGDPGDQYCYSLNCCHNSRDQVSVVDPASAGSGTCCDDAGWWTQAQHGAQDVAPEALQDPVRVFEDLTGLDVPLLE